ncbi:MAG TPA: hypothetical protein VFH68_19875 [Polyangia bacterium]|jgi:hypothetical protein|nr:hypothetical protein [Polyangia bacterium]
METPLLALAALGLFGVFAVARVVYADLLSPEARVKRSLVRRPRVAIARAPDGVVRITGRVRAGGALLVAPVTQRPCVAYQLVIEGDEQGSWGSVLELQDARPFTLVDQTGEAFVDVADRSFLLALVPDKRGWTRSDADQDASTQAVRLLLRSAHVAIDGMFDGPRRFRYREAALVEGRRVAVGGQGTREVTPDGARPSVREPPQRYVVRGSADEPLLISDLREALGQSGE